MKHLRGGRFEMGSNHFYEDERPVRSTEVGDFWIDETPVTNAQFMRFVKATGHVSFAEIPPDPDDYPDMDPKLAIAGSIVFTPPSAPMDLLGDPVWWSFVPGASWRHPLGPESDIAGKGNHPVVHIAHSDALAYAEWAGKSLPTEPEWEYAARGGLDGAEYAWGGELFPGGKRMANIWEGFFPVHNAARPGLERTSPVRHYPANGYGLYDMIGNVWEWTADTYDRGAPRGGTGSSCCGGTTKPASVARMVAKGGSHLCAQNYCQRYRPAARWPQPVDTTTSHMGFRCILRP